jgi:hypothetical protein
MAIMDRTARRLPDPTLRGITGERRRYIRHRLHTPVYASFNGPQTGMVVDLSELLDLHEDGFAVQTSEPLEVDRAVTLCLDLPETKSFIHGSGHVVWSDDAGRGGIRLSGLPESSRRKLQEWLFANLLIACSNYVARTEQRDRYMEENSPQPAANQFRAVVPGSVVPIPDVPISVPISDGTGMLSPVEAVGIEVREAGENLDAVLQLITDRALELTGASGAALAFLTDNTMICRARTGDPAPPLGAPVDVTQGLSGECVRSGLLVWCDDMENDPRVDPEIGRALGVGSLMAAPIVSDFRMLGLLEVFSPQADAFTAAHATILSQLVQLIPGTHQPEEPIQPEAVSSVSAVSASEMDSTESTSTQEEPEVLREPEFEAREQVSEHAPEPIVADPHAEPNPEPAPKTASTISSRLLSLGLLGLAIAVVAMVAGYLSAPIIEKRWPSSAEASQQRPANETVSGQSATGHVSSDQNSSSQSHLSRVYSLADLQRLAAQGDADAEWQMGVRYHNGEDVPHDDAQAMQWFERSAQQGNVAAEGALGAYYWAGRGVPEDLSKAYFWSTIALAQGDENSKIRLEGLSSQMTPSQINAARQQAEIWIHAHNAAKAASN